MNSSAALTRLAAFVCVASTVFLAGCSDNRSYSPSSPTPFPVANGGTPAAGGQSAKPLDEYGDDAPMPQPEPPPPAPSLTIVITSRNGAQSFLPNPADAAGQFVVFRNADSILHRVVRNDGTIDTGNIAPGATSVPVLMPATGTNYHCALHPDMVGSVTTPAGTPPPGGEPPPPYEPPPYEPPPYYYQLP